MLTPTRAWRGGRGEQSFHRGGHRAVSFESPGSERNFMKLYFVVSVGVGTVMSSGCGRLILPQSPALRLARDARHVNVHPP